MAISNNPSEITFDESVLSRAATVEIWLRSGSPDVNQPYASDDLRA